MTARKKRSSTPSAPPLVPRLGPDDPVDWWFAFKFNADSFPKCADGARRKGIFGGQPRSYPRGWSQQYVVASGADPTLAEGVGCLGCTPTDPLGATFAQVYDGRCNYVLWNDQFYGAPQVPCGEKSEHYNCSSPWGHSKGLLAWDDDGNGFSLQVTTPSWPASGSKDHPRQGDGNTLGTVADDDIMVSQHFFALRLTRADVVAVLKALGNASVATDPDNLQVVKNGGPAAIPKLVAKLGVRSESTKATVAELSTGVRLLSKPSDLCVPPWQMVSALLGGVPLRVASWWERPEIYSTKAGSTVGCWDDALGAPGAVEIATTGTWAGTSIGLEGGLGDQFNHAKLGVSTRSEDPFAIFGDMNQQGALSRHYAYKDQKCDSSQNGRGGTFYVMKDRKLWTSLSALLAGDSAPLAPPPKTSPKASGSS